MARCQRSAAAAQVQLQQSADVAAEGFHSINCSLWQTLRRRRTSIAVGVSSHSGGMGACQHTPGLLRGQPAE